MGAVVPKTNKQNFIHFNKHDGCLYGQLEVKQNIVNVPTA
jgi:hypothetical protein